LRRVLDNRADAELLRPAGLTILTDASNDELDLVPGHDVQSLSIAEPASFAPNKVVFTLKVQSLSTVPPNTDGRLP
jgi:hypothetical protein